MIKQHDYTYNQVSLNFSFDKENVFQNPAGFINKIILERINKLPACKILTEYVHEDRRNFVNRTDAVDSLKSRLEGQKVNFLYPENYEDIEGNDKSTSVYVVAKNKKELASALQKIGSFASYELADRINKRTLSF